MVGLEVILMEPFQNHQNFAAEMISDFILDVLKNKNQQQIL